MDVLTKEGYWLNCSKGHFSRPERSEIGKFGYFVNLVNFLINGEITFL